MNIKKEVNLFINKQPFCVSYTQDDHPQGNATTLIYDKYKISILLSDGLAAVINDTVIDTGKNSILFFRPDEIHFGRFFCDGVHSYLDFYIPLTFFEEFFGGTELATFFTDTSHDRVNYITLDPAHQKDIMRISQKTTKAIMSDTSSSNVELFSSLLQVILMCNEFYETQKSNPHQNKIPELVSRTLLYISENFDRKLSLTELASDVGCSVTYLSKVFKQHTGKTIYNHLIETRISNAQIMLKQGFSVTDTCFSSGFEDCSNFCKTFKKLTGKKPLHYKNTINM